MKLELAALLACVALAPGCGFVANLLYPPEPLPTVPGPESPELVRSTRLHLAEVREGRLLLRRLSDGSVTEFSTSRGRIVALSGPDREGRVAYLGMEGGTLRSSYVWIDDIEPSQHVQAFPLGPGERHFSMHGFRLSPVRGRLAFESERTSGVYALELLDLASGELRILWNGSCDELAWFPDGNRLAFTELDGTAREQSTIHIVDCDSGALLGAWGPVNHLDRLWSAPDGSHLYLATGWWDNHTFWRLDLATGQYERLSLPGLRMPIAFTEDGKLLGYALPTEGSKQEYTYSPIKTAAPNAAIKLFDLASGAFCTVAPPAGRFDALSAGEVGQ